MGNGASALDVEMSSLSSPTGTDRPHIRVNINYTQKLNHLLQICSHINFSYTCMNNSFSKLIQAKRKINARRLDFFFLFSKSSFLFFLNLLLNVIAGEGEILMYNQIENLGFRISIAQRFSGSFRSRCIICTYAHMACG